MTRYSFSFSRERFFKMLYKPDVLLSEVMILDLPHVALSKVRLRGLNTWKTHVLVFLEAESVRIVVIR